MSNAYPIALAAGTLASLLWIGLYVPPSRSTTPDYNLRGLDAGLWAVFMGLAGARLGFALLHLDYFKSNIQEITWFWNGGLSWIGGVLGALVGIGIYALLNKHRFWPLADTVALAAPILGFASWFGCLYDSCAYGKRADVGLLTPPSSDMFGVEASRWPVQGTGAIICLLIFLFLFTLRRRKLNDGIITTVSLSLISAGNLFLYFFRGDSIRLVNGLRLDALATVPLLLSSLIALVILSKGSIFIPHRNKT
ncbi:MAG: prolipoprotein diacylglyceryl transferase family protein [Anaerolineales bacterium]